MDFKKIQTYLLDISSINDDNFNELLRVVKEYRKNKINMLMMKDSKYLSLGVELLIKKALIDAGLDYEKTEIIFNEFGKPYLKDGNLFFNTSHSGKFAICVIADKEVGIDIQEIKDLKTKIAERYFTKKENQYIDISDDKDDMFYRIWSLKESYSKCVGKGLSLPLNSYELSNIDNNIVIDGKDDYQFFEQKFDNYRIAWCINTTLEDKDNYNSSIKLVSF